MGTRDRKYNAHIELMAIFPMGDPFVAEDLAKLVKAADRMVPWQDSYADGTPAPSLQSVSKVTVAEGEWIDRRYTLHVNPPFMLAFSQLHAYEQYGQGLARHVASTIPTRCLRVDSRLMVEGTFKKGFRPGILQQPIGQIR